MRRIHDEDPSYWPYGLASDQFNGGLYLVKRAADVPVGFVGWQKMKEGGRDVGYYAIGILPEHRQQSFAKQAVARVLQEIGDQCDEVKALIMSHNAPSKALARSLSIPILEKLANEKAASSGRTQALSSLLGAIGTTALFDQSADPSRTLESTFKPWQWDKERALMGGLNAILGGLGGNQLSKGEIGKGLGAIALAPTKDLALKGIDTLHHVDDAAKKFADTPTVGGRLSPAVMAGAGGLGLGALALLTYSAKRKADHRDAVLEEQRKGRVRITLPTKAPGDNETEVELPFADLNLSAALRSRLGRDTRRRLYSETKQRTKRRQPANPESPTDKEREDLALMAEEAELDKAASIAESLSDLVSEIAFYKSAASMPPPAPQGAVPTPPQVGQNPAVRMNQQSQAVANSIQPSTDANPQIMEAEQAAMAAEQASSQQLAQMEQQAQQAQMQQQQQFQEELMRSEQEKEVLKLQLEKEKALQDLSAAQSKAQTDAGRGEGTEAQRLVSNRLSRLSKRVKAATVTPARTLTPTKPAKGNPVAPGTPGTLSPSTGQKIPEPPIYLKPHAADRVNDYAGSAGMIPSVGVTRHSYGPLLDTVYDGLFRQRLLTPDAPPPAALSRSAMLNTPDKMGMISQLLSGGQAQNPMSYLSAAAGSLS